MADKVTRFDQTVDAISWAGLVILWVVAAFFRFILRQDPEVDGAIGIIGGTYWPKVFPQMAPAMACTILFLLLTVMIRINPASVPSRIFRYLRFLMAVAALAIYGCMCYSYATMDLQ